MRIDQKNSTATCNGMKQLHLSPIKINYYQQSSKRDHYIGVKICIINEEGHFHNENQTGGWEICVCEMKHVHSLKDNFDYNSGAIDNFTDSKICYFELHQRLAPISSVSNLKKVNRFFHEKY